MKATHKVIWDDVLQAEFHLFIGTREQLFRAKLCQKDDQIPDGWCGATIHMDCFDVIFINTEYKSTNWLRTLVHECVHAATHLLRNVMPDSESISVDTEEMVARYTEYLVGSFVGYLPTRR